MAVETTLARIDTACQHADTAERAAKLVRRIHETARMDVTDLSVWSSSVRFHVSTPEGLAVCVTVMRDGVRVKWQTPSPRRYAGADNSYAAEVSMGSDAETEAVFDMIAASLSFRHENG